MKIMSYEFADDSWRFLPVEFQNINLIVGESGSGKTRLLNTMFNLATHVAHKQLGGASRWKLKTSVGDNIYSWEIATKRAGVRSVVSHEKLFLMDKLILERDDVNCTFDGKTTFKLPDNEMSISAMRDEELIRPLYDGFSQMLRRRFWGDEIEKLSTSWGANMKVLKKIGESKNLRELYKADPPLSYRLWVLKEYFPPLFEKITSAYAGFFPFIEDLKIIDSDSDKLTALDIPFSRVPIFCIRERSVDKWIRLDELSSGMQKALLITTDLFALPSDIIYLIDEYENSLGVGGINLLPDLLLAGEIQQQLFITSHHPYVISNLPVEYWYIAHRKGGTVQFTYGKELVDRYDFSKQDQYLQLLNDPIYVEGIE